MSPFGRLLEYVETDELGNLFIRHSHLTDSCWADYLSTKGAWVYLTCLGILVRD
jgi:hypothetical protein